MGREAGRFSVVSRFPCWRWLCDRGACGEPDNLILVYLRRIDEKLDRPPAAVADLGDRVTSLETKVALLDGGFAAQSKRIERLDVRLDRIERRLEIVPV
jgi:hypothetical protein